MTTKEIETCDQIGDLLTDIGWVCRNDAQWSRLLEALPRIKVILDKLEPNAGAEPVAYMPQNIAEALMFSRNFAEASPALTNTAKMHINGLADLLEAAHSKPAANGFKLVPLEPTPEMLAAADKVNDQSYIHNYGKAAHPDDLYYAMIDAAPQPTNESTHEEGGKCENKKKPGGCPLHNLHCGYPKCDK